MKIYQSECPCKECPYRQVGCHDKGKCENPTLTYDEWKNNFVEKSSCTFFSNKLSDNYKRKRAIAREMGYKQ